MNFGHHAVDAPGEPAFARRRLGLSIRRVRPATQRPDLRLGVARRDRNRPKIGCAVVKKK
jgi:hypothetical protein